jgi:MFS family permease
MTYDRPARAVHVPGRPEQIATRILFFVAGLSMAAWAPLVPFAKARLGLNDGTLGLLLLCLGGGSMVAMPLSGALAERFGCRRVLVASTLSICVALPLLATAPSLSLLMAVLAGFGAGVGMVSSVINIQAVIVERASGRSMMSGFHGLFSVGGIVGAGGVSAQLSRGVSPLGAVLCVAAAIVLALLLAAPNLLPYGSERSGPAFAIPHGVVLFIGLLCFIVFMTEGSVLDWSAVFLSSVRGMDASHAGIGYAAFALMMTGGRLCGDGIVGRLGGKKIIAIGGCVAATGFALTVLVPYWQAALFGYALVGAGCSNIVPVLYSAAGRQATMPENIAVPAVSTMGYTGILMGPAAIGFVAHATSLPVAFLIIAILLLGVAVSGRVLRA